MPITQSMFEAREAAKKSTTTKMGGLYSNLYLSAEKVEKPTYTRWRVTLGEEGRGRKLLDLTCPEGTKVLQGQNPFLSIGTTRSGRPKLIFISSPADGNKQYLLLSAQGTYTRCGNGKIYWHKENFCQYKLLDNGWGADGAAGRIGYWDAVLLSVEGYETNAAHDWICIRPGGRREWDTCKFIFMGAGEIYQFDSPNDVRGFCEAHDLVEPSLDWEDDSVWEDVTQSSPAESD